MSIPSFELAQLSLDTKVSLQTIIGIFVWVVSFIVFMTTVRDDIKTMKEWVKAHQQESVTRSVELTTLGKVAERLTTLIEALTDRVERVENTIDHRHGRRSE